MLLVDLLGFPAPPGKTFEIVIQLGAIAAVCLLYRRRLWRAATGLARDPAERAFVRNLLFAFLPAMAVGAVAYPLIKRLLGAPEVVAAALVLGGIAILAIERLVTAAPRFRSVDEFSAGLSLRIGLFQVISMVPGVSRSGATIMGALLVGVERRAAAEFSFFLAIPTMAGATVYSLYKNWTALDFHDAGVIGVGFAMALVATLGVVRAALAFIGRYGFAPFAWYRIAVGGIMLAVLAGS